MLVYWDDFRERKRVHVEALMKVHKKKMRAKYLYMCAYLHRFLRSLIRQQKAKIEEHSRKARELWCSFRIMLKLKIALRYHN